MRTVYKLTENEEKIVGMGLEDPNVYMNYWFRGPGMKQGWQFDHNFIESGKWQKEFVMASQTNLMVSGGVGSGKTLTVGMAACYMCGVIHPDFRFLNAAPFSYQAAQMYKMILRNAEGTPYNNLIYKVREKPTPQIVVKFRIRDSTVTSTMEFMSVDKNAKSIFSYEGDWINLEEGAMLDNLEEVMISLGTRLRGSFRGRARIGRMSIITNPWENPYFWYMFDLAEGDPENYLSMYVETEANQNITDKQLTDMIKRIPPHERDRFLKGTRPEGKGVFFNKEKVRVCASNLYTVEIVEGMKKGEGYKISKSVGVGVDYYEMPPMRGGRYMLFGDLGTDAAPGRNAPALMVFDITRFPEKAAKMVAFWWGNGMGSIKPFVKWLFEFAGRYRPMVTAVDSTGSQKYTAEILNTFIASDDYSQLKNLTGLSTISLPDNYKISGMDFSGPKKMAYLRSASFLVETELLTWPDCVVGLKSQLINYDPIKDTIRRGAIPQDLVATLSMAAYVIRRHFYIEIPGEEDAQEIGETSGLHYKNALRRPNITLSDRGRRYSGGR